MSCGVPRTSQTWATSLQAQTWPWGWSLSPLAVGLGCFGFRHALVGRACHRHFHRQKAITVFPIHVAAGVTDSKEVDCWLTKLSSFSEKMQNRKVSLWEIGFPNLIKVMTRRKDRDSFQTSAGQSWRKNRKQIIFRNNVQLRQSR